VGQIYALSFPPAMKWVSRVNEPAVEMPCSLSCCLCSVLLNAQAIKITKTKNQKLLTSFQKHGLRPLNNTALRMHLPTIRVSIELKSKQNHTSIPSDTNNFASCTTTLLVLPPSHEKCGLLNKCKAQGLSCVTNNPRKRLTDHESG
jgi:hypothetical protein